jgi:site-specific recombinase XerD
VFRGAAGRRLGKRQAQRRVGDLARRAGLGIARPHALRHSFAVGLYERCGDLAVVQRALGHASIASTLRYASATDEQLRRAMGA